MRRKIKKGKCPFCREKEGVIFACTINIFEIEVGKIFSSKWFKINDGVACKRIIIVVMLEI
jgi:hypothetical protein